MKKYLIILFVLLLNNTAVGSNKEYIIQNLKSIENLSFNFEQNINGKIENGNCIIKYPKKIYCKYNLPNKKILVSNGKSLVVKTLSSYYRYPINKTVLNLILDKNFLISQLKKSKGRIVDKKFINFTFNKDENEINIFFNNSNYDLVGWQTLDIYQNLNITFLSSIIKNQNIKKNLFKLPNQN